MGATAARKERAARTKINQGMSLRNLLEKSPYVGQINLVDGVAISPNPEHHVGCSDEMKATLLPLMPAVRATMAGLWEKEYEPAGITKSLWHNTIVEHDGEMRSVAEASAMKGAVTRAATKRSRETPQEAEEQEVNRQQFRQRYQQEQEQLERHLAERRQQEGETVAAAAAAPSDSILAGMTTAGQDSV
ncbi:hypothetical protein ACK3TF_000279 [Chlorella vulgaris]